MARSPYGVARIAVTILASTVMSVVVAPVVGEFFIGLAKEHHIYEASYEWPGKVMSWLLKISELPGLRGAALFLAGLATGMWVDTIARRRAGRPPNVKHWFPLGEALTVFVNADLHSALAAARQRAADTQELGVRLWGQMEDIKKKQSLADSLNSFDLESDFMSLSRQRRKAEIQMPIDEQEVTAAQRRIDRFLFDKLAAGRLLARGLPYRNHIISDEIEIPSAFWRVMVIDRNDKELQTVGGNGALYVGVRVGQPS